MKTWQKKRTSDADALAGRLGLSSWTELANCYLLINISYGGQADGGRTLFVKAERIELRSNEIYFDFDHSRIKTWLDAHPKKRMGGALKDLDTSADIEIEGLGFDGSGWIALFWTSGMQSELHRENLDVQVIVPKH